MSQFGFPESRKKCLKEKSKYFERDIRKEKGLWRSVLTVIGFYINEEIIESNLIRHCEQFF